MAVVSGPVAEPAAVSLEAAPRGSSSGERRDGTSDWVSVQASNGAGGGELPAWAASQPSLLWLRVRSGAVDDTTSPAYCVVRDPGSYRREFLSRHFAPGACVLRMHCGACALRLQQTRLFLAVMSVTFNALAADQTLLAVVLVVHSLWSISE